MSKSGKHQAEIPGTERITSSIPELDEVIRKWNKAKDKRVKAQVPEKAHKQRMLELVKENRSILLDADGVLFYEYHDGDLTVTIKHDDKFTVSTRTDVHEQAIG